MPTGRARVQVTSAGLTTALTAYAALDQVGTILTFAGMAVGTGGTGSIRSISVVDETSTTSMALRAFVFRSSVTLASDNAAFSLSDADAEAMIDGPDGGGGFELGPILSYTNGSRQSKTNLDVDYDCAATSLFIALQAVSTRTFFTAVGDLKVTLTVNVLS